MVGLKSEVCASKPFRHIGGVLFLALLLASGCNLSKSDAPGNGKIRISSVPAGAMVTCNGREYGVTPVTVDKLESGNHLLLLRKDGYRDFRHTVSLFKGQETFLEFTLDPLQGLLLVESDPVGAEVVIDDKFCGYTPLFMHEIHLGTHELRLQSQNWAPRRLSVEIQNSRPKRVYAKLASDSSILNVVSQPAKAKVLINGSDYGETPLDAVRIKAGKAQLEIKKNGYLPNIREMVFHSGEEYDVNLALKPLPSGLTLVAKEGKAQVFVDKEYRGETPITLTNVSSGPHEIRLVKEGFETYSETIQLEPGARDLKEVRMEKNSGDIVLVTEPSAVQIYLDGERLGTSKSDKTSAVSVPFERKNIAEGSHVLQFVKEGFEMRQIVIRISASKVVSRHVKLNRLFIPDTKVITGQHVLTGVLIKKYPDGDVEVMTYPKIVEHIEGEEIDAIIPIKSQN